MNRRIYAAPWVGWLFYGVLGACFAFPTWKLWSFAHRAHTVLAIRMCCVFAYSLLFGFIVTVFALVSAGRRGAGLARDPERPWLWREDWASGRCEESTSESRAQVGMVAFATPAVIGIPWIALGALEEAGLYRSWLAAAGYALALLPLFIVTRGFVGQRRHLRRFGRSALSLTRVPIVPGDTLNATLTTERPLRGAESATLTLSCLRRVTDGDSSHEETIWTQSKKVSADGGRDLPVVFELPANLPGTDPLGLDTEVFWRLVAAAPMPGITYEASFLLPVFGRDRQGVG